MSEGSRWRMFARAHRGVVALFAAACVAAFAGSVYVLLWFSGDAVASGLVPGALGLWTMADLVTFVLSVVFWELLLVGIPTVLAMAGGWLWYRGLPDEEKSRYRLFEERSRARSGGGGGMSLLFFVAFCIKVYADGMWDTAISTWTLDYVVGSMVLVLGWFVVIFGIPLAIWAAWWVRRGRSGGPGPGSPGV